MGGDRNPGGNPKRPWCDGIPAIKRYQGWYRTMKEEQPTQQAVWQTAGPIIDGSDDQPSAGRQSMPKASIDTSSPISSRSRRWDW